MTIWGDGKAVRDFLHVKDVAVSFRRAIEYTGSHTVFNIGSSHGTSLNDLIVEFRRVSGIEIPVQYQNGRTFDVRSNILNTELAGIELGWSPIVTLSAGIEGLVQHTQQRSLAA